MGLRDRLSYRGVTAFYGMPGSGKTYGLAEVGLREIRAGRPVYSNAGFDLAGSEIFASFDDFMAIPNGATVVWDELPLYVNSRKWAEFPDGLLYRLTQIRKDGLRLYYSTIDPAMVDTNVRRVTFWWWECHSLTSRIMRRSLWPHESFRKRDARPHRRELVRVKSAVADAYDTLGKVAVEAHVVNLGKRSGTWTMGTAGAPPAAGTPARSGPGVRRQVGQPSAPPVQVPDKLADVVGHRLAGPLGQEGRPQRLSGLLEAASNSGEVRPQGVPVRSGHGSVRRIAQVSVPGVRRLVDQGGRGQGQALGEADQVGEVGVADREASGEVDHGRRRRDQVRPQLVELRPGEDDASVHRIAQVRSLGVDNRAGRRSPPVGGTPSAAPVGQSRPAGANGGRGGSGTEDGATKRP